MGPMYSIRPRNVSLCNSYLITKNGYGEGLCLTEQYNIMSVLIRDIGKAISMPIRLRQMYLCVFTLYFGRSTLIKCDNNKALFI